jgi:hypothetical protein
MQLYFRGYMHRFLPYLKYHFSQSCLFHLSNSAEDSLMLVPCIIRCSRNNQHYALNCTSPLFYILAPICFGSSLPSSGSFLDPSELLEIQIEWVGYHLICGYVACVLDGSLAHRSRNHTLYDILGSTTHRTTTLQHTGHVTTHYMIYWEAQHMEPRHSSTQVT